MWCSWWPSHGAPRGSKPVQHPARQRHDQFSMAQGDEGRLMTHPDADQYPSVYRQVQGHEACSASKTTLSALVKGIRSLGSRRKPMAQLSSFGKPKVAFQASGLGRPRDCIISVTNNTIDVTTGGHTNDRHHPHQQLTPAEAHEQQLKHMAPDGKAAVPHGPHRQAPCGCGEKASGQCASIRWHLS